MNIQLFINEKWVDVRALAIVFLKGETVSITTDTGLTIRTTKDKVRYE